MPPGVSRAGIYWIGSAAEKLNTSFMQFDRVSSQIETAMPESLHMKYLFLQSLNVIGSA
jgi:hypothetical protein